MNKEFPPRQELLELIAWHQKACVELARDMTQENYNEVVNSRTAIIGLFDELTKE